MSEEINYTVIRQFGPSVFKVKIPINIIESLNNITDEILLSKEKQQKFDPEEVYKGQPNPTKI